MCTLPLLAGENISTLSAFKDLLARDHPFQCLAMTKVQMGAGAGAQPGEAR